MARFEIKHSYASHGNSSVRDYTHAHPTIRTTFAVTIVSHPFWTAATDKGAFLVPEKQSLDCSELCRNRLKPVQEGVKTLEKRSLPEIRQGKRSPGDAASVITTA